VKILNFIIITCVLDGSDNYTITQIRKYAITQDMSQSYNNRNALPWLPRNSDGFPTNTNPLPQLITYPPQTLSNVTVINVGKSENQIDACMHQLNGMSLSDSNHTDTSNVSPMEM
jgi:hypothetical protein